MEMSEYERKESWSYHTKYNVKDGAIKAIREAVQVDGFWKAKNNADGDKCLMILGNLGKKLCEIYKIALHGEITYGDYEAYFFVRRSITLVRPSLISYLHEFRHHWQTVKGKRVGSEPDARKWSLGAFRKAFPKAFDDAWKNNRLMWMPEYPKKEE
jgi:hypothetical protein